MGTVIYKAVFKHAALLKRMVGLFGFFFFQNTVFNLQTDITEKHTLSGSNIYPPVLRNLKVTFYEVINRKIGIESKGEIWEKSKKTIR